MKKPEDESWMERALCEGRKGVGLTSSNPPVGAIIVKDGVELASGWHQKSGTPHAERNALAALKNPQDGHGATIYITLEPCSSHGRTGACTQALIEAGFARVVYGSRDAHPSHQGRADEMLRAAGIEVVTGVLEEECDYLNRCFAKVQRTGLPWVIAKTAMSLDGRITRPPGEGQWLSSPLAREDVQHLRAEVDAILTSGETVRRDDPLLTLRSEAISSKKLQPLRVILTQKDLTQNDYQIFNDGHATRVFKEKEISDVLRTLVKEHDASSVLLECGGKLMGSFLDEGMIDEMVVYLAPLVTGGPSSAIGGKGVEDLNKRLQLKDPVIRRLGPDMVVRGLVSDEKFALER